MQNSSSFFCLRNLVESSEEFVKSGNELGGCQFFRQRSEVDDVGIQYAEKNGKKCRNKIDFSLKRLIPLPQKLRLPN
jgi:hypothetical protein